MSGRKRYVGVRLLWDWNYRFWAWFTWHGIQSAYTSGRYDYDFKCNHHVMIQAPDRVYDVVYHLGPLKIKIGVLP